MNIFTTSPPPSLPLHWGGILSFAYGDTKFVSEMLRHKSVSFTAQTYVHLESKYKRNRVHDFVI